MHRHMHHALSHAHAHEDGDYTADVADGMDDVDGRNVGICVLVRLYEFAHVCLCAPAHVQLK